MSYSHLIPIFFVWNKETFAKNTTEIDMSFKYFRSLKEVIWEEFKTWLSTAVIHSMLWTIIMMESLQQADIKTENS